MYTLLSIKKKFDGTVAGLYEGCRMVVKYCEINQTNKLEVEEGLNINEHMVSKYIDVGVGHIKPELLFYHCPGHTKLQKCGRALQEKLYGKEVPVAIRYNHAWAETSMLISSLTGKQANQVFTAGYVRTVEEQIQHMEFNDKKNTQVKISASYTVTDNGIVLHHDGSKCYTKAELKALLKLCN
jgi:hypothetical protein